MAGAGRDRNFMNNMLVNKKSRFGLAVKVSALTLATYAVIVVMTVAAAGDNLSGGSARRADDLVKAIATQDAIVKSFLEYSRRSNDSGVTVSSDRVLRDHARSMTAVKNHYELIKARERSTRYLLTGMGIVMALYLIILFSYLVYKTGGLYGPAGVMLDHVRDSRNRKVPSMTPVDTGGELADLRSINITQHSGDYHE